MCIGRDFGAWLGLVPEQISTEDRTIFCKVCNGLPGARENW